MRHAYCSRGRTGIIEMTIHPSVGTPNPDYNTEAPASAVFTSAAPQPREPAAAALAARAAERMSELLPTGIQSLLGQALAVFEWQTVTGKEGESTVSVSGCEGNSFELTWSHGESRQCIKAKAEVYCWQQEEVGIRVRIGRGFRDWSLATPLTLEAWLAGTPTASSLPNPRGASGLEYLGHVWFSDNDGHDSGVTRRGRAAWRLPAVGRFWPRFSLKNARRSWDISELPRLEGKLAAEDCGGAVAAFTLWTLLTQLFQESNDDDEPGAIAYGLPPQKDYFPQRAVNLNGSAVLAQLRQDAYRLRVPWHVIEAACASLNSGKHVLFTGPPGCGKSKLAIALAQLATNCSPLLVTASPAWTSGDLIGRYLPSRTGQGLEFVPGAFLRAAEQERWLIIDEFNRANIDECFGELFSVLANDTVELPFEAPLNGERPDGAPQYAPVRIVPALRAGEAATGRERVHCDYQVSPSFRLIGTMNDADRSRLHQLSFALQRRFDVIRIEAPPWNVVREIIDHEMTVVAKNLRHAYRFFQKTAARTMERHLTLDRLGEQYFYGLFARDPAESKRGDVIDLVSERVVGLATVRDVMSFVSEGLRGPVGQSGQARVSLPEDMTTHDVAASYIAMGIVLSVFPQLEAVPRERLVPIVRFIIDCFRDDSSNSLPLLRLTTVEDGELPFTVERVRASDGNLVDQDGDTWISIPEYMVSELIRQFKGSIPEHDLLDLIRREPQPSES